MGLTDKLTEIGNAIREKNGTTELIPLADMPQAILDIVGGGGVQYTSIVYNDDDTITLIDTDGVTHTMVCVYEEDKLKSATYDGKEIKLHYTDDALDMVGKTEVNLSNAKSSGVTTVDHTVTFLADGKPYEVVSVKDGNTVNAPSGIPTSENGTFTKWKSDGEAVIFPITPTEDVEINAVFQTVRSEISTDKAGTYLGSVLGTKTNDGLCVYGYGYTGGYTYYYAVGRTESDIATTPQLESVWTIEYDGEIWVAGNKRIQSEPIVDGDIEFYDMGNTPGQTKQMLDYFFIKS